MDDMWHVEHVPLEGIEPGKACPALEWKYLIEAPPWRSMGWLVTPSEVPISGGSEAQISPVVIRE